MCTKSSTKSCFFLIARPFNLTFSRPGPAWAFIFLATFPTQTREELLILLVKIKDIHWTIFTRRQGCNVLKEKPMLCSLIFHWLYGQNFKSEFGKSLYSLDLFSPQTLPFPQHTWVHPDKGLDSDNGCRWHHLAQSLSHFVQPNFQHRTYIRISYLCS